MTSHLHTAHALADVSWLRRSRCAYAAWHLRAGALMVGCAIIGLTVQAQLTTVATAVLASIGAGSAVGGLLLGATYGRIVAALAAALAAGYTPHWLAARIDAREGEPRRLAAELEEFAAGEPA